MTEALSCAAGRRVCTFRDKAPGGHRARRRATPILVAAGPHGEDRWAGTSRSVGSPRGRRAMASRWTSYSQTHATRVYAVGDALMKHFAAHVAAPRRRRTSRFRTPCCASARRWTTPRFPGRRSSDPDGGRGRHQPKRLCLQPRRVPHRACIASDFGEIDQAVIDGQTDGFAKVVAVAGRKDTGCDGRRRRPGACSFMRSRRRWPRACRCDRSHAAVPIEPSYGRVLRELAIGAKAGKLEKGYIQTGSSSFMGLCRGRAPGTGRARVRRLKRLRRWARGSWALRNGRKSLRGLTLSVPRAARRTISAMERGIED